MYRRMYNPYDFYLLNQDRIDFKDVYKNINYPFLEELKENHIPNKYRHLENLDYEIEDFSRFIKKKPKRKILKKNLIIDPYNQGYLMIYKKMNLPDYPIYKKIFEKLNENPLATDEEIRKIIDEDYSKRKSIH